jgi:VWFA-related protein
MRIRIALLGLALPSLLLAAQQQAELPRFRAGTNLVRVDAYVSTNGVPITDLKAEDVIVYEDDKPQTIEHFELIAAQGPVPDSARVNPATVGDMRDQAAGADRVFTLFFDNLFVSIDGSYHAQKPIVDTLDKVIGGNDLVGVMTPDMSPSSITYSRRTSSIERMVTDTWHWGKRDSKMPLSPQEEAFVGCYGIDGARPFIARLREQQTLDALEALVVHLEGLRPERKFVLVFTEGWSLFRPDDRLTRTRDGGNVPGQDPIQVDPRTGKIVPQGGVDPQSGTPSSYDACERQRTMLSYIDHEFKFRELLQRANRANVSFYPIDARGLIVFDTPIEWGIPPTVDAAWLRDRQDDLRMMALQTDGQVVLNTNDVSTAMQKMLADLGSYYLMSYYSTNTKLDGRFRRLRVEVKREGVDVRARPGYLAPTEAEARAAGVTIERPGMLPAPPPAVTRALDALAPARGNLPVRVQAAGGRGTIRAVIEIDPATAKQPEWSGGATLKVTIEPERLLGATVPAGSSQTVTLAIGPGQRSVAVDSEQPVSAGRYSVRAELTPRSGRTPIQVTTFTIVPADAAEVGSGALALRRGPSTGLAYVPTADPRFRRTERLRIEIPIAGEGFTGSGRLLTREGSPTPLVVTVGTRTDAATGRSFAVAEVTLAPLAAGEYVLEASLVKNGKTEIVTYGFRIIP